MEKKFYVYILASGKHGTLYIGVTSDLLKRVWEHKNKVVKLQTDLLQCEIYSPFSIHSLLEILSMFTLTQAFFFRSWSHVLGHLELFISNTLTSPTNIASHSVLYSS